MQEKGEGEDVSSMQMPGKSVATSRPMGCARGGEGGGIVTSRRIGCAVNDAVCVCAEGGSRGRLAVSYKARGGTIGGGRRHGNCSL